MKQKRALAELPLGLLEMDYSGTILYYERERDGASGGDAPDLVGRNLFTDVTPVSCSPDFRRLVKGFCDGHAPNASFQCAVRIGDRDLPVRVLLARLHEKSQAGRRDSVIVQIKPDSL